MISVSTEIIIDLLIWLFITVPHSIAKLVDLRCQEEELSTGKMDSLLNVIQLEENRHPDGCLRGFYKNRLNPAIDRVHQQLDPNLDPQCRLGVEIIMERDISNVHWTPGDVDDILGYMFLDKDWFNKAYPDDVGEG